MQEDGWPRIDGMAPDDWPDVARIYGDSAAEIKSEHA